MFVIEVRGKWRKKLKVILGYMQNSRRGWFGLREPLPQKKKEKLNENGNT